MLIERQAIVRLEEGLHARPAARVVQMARSFACSIEILKGETAANAKSTVKLMLLAVKEGERITIRADGDDADEAVDGLVALVSGDDGDAQRQVRAAPPARASEAAMPTPADDPSVIRGVSGNDGVAVGRAFVYLPRTVLPDRRSIPPEAVDSETARFRAAVLSVCALFEDAARASADSTERQILEALKDLAQDSEFVDPVERRIAACEDAAFATLAAGAELAERFSRIDDAYLQTRAEDVRGIARQVADMLLGVERADLSQLREPSVLVAGALSALDFARLPMRLVTGLLTTEGGATSHVAIIARSMGFPAVVGARATEAQLRAIQTIALDGSQGIAIPNPDAATEARFRARLAEADAARRALEGFVHVEPRTRAGIAIEVAANIGSPAEIEAALEHGAMGVGLFRTEFLFMRAVSLPSEDEQARIYAQVLRAFAPHPVLIRTLDIGGDKALPGLPQEAEENPFLGWRGIRMCLDRPELFKPQLRALLRAATAGRLRVMFPMISDVSEVRAARAMLADCAGELAAEGIATGPIEVGIMIETPAAALCADALAREVAFFSIGTNDLTQYTMAADRTNARLSRLGRADHPAVLRMIEMACSAARAAGIWVGVCGEAAGDPAMIPRLLSWGVTELSMSPPLIPRAKKTVIES